MKLEAFLRPESIAVIGASREPDKVGHRVFKNLVDSGFLGHLYPVNPKTDELLGFKCYKTISDIPDNIDLAVLVVPAGIVPTVAEECGSKRVKGIVVISAGFGEIGREGTALERSLLTICQKYEMRMQGPNCLGIISTQSRMNASFASANPNPGNIAFVSQSGALGSTILNWALQNGIGFTKFVSLGNEADLTAADFIEALAEDEGTKMIGLYVEGVKDGAKFIDVARIAVKKTPIIALKAGTTEVGIRAVSSHTGSLAGFDTAFSAAFRKAGVLRVQTLEDLFHLVMAFGSQPLPKGKKILIITNGGGPGILATDSCEKMDLDLPLLEHESIEELRRSIPPHASLNNPVDLLGDADENRYRLALNVGLKSKNVDGVIVILTPQAMTPVDRVADVVAEARRFSSKPIITAFMGLDDDSKALKTLRRAKIPNYVFPESAAYVLRSMYDYSLISGATREDIQSFMDVDDERIKEILDKVTREERLSLTIEETASVAKAYRIRMPKGAIARDKDEAGSIADSIGYPVAMKVVSPDVMHKTDVGGVALNIKTRDQVEESYENIVRKIHVAMPEARILGVLAQESVPPGKEVIIGAVRDLQFGPMMMFGLGGIYVNFLRDVSYCLCPLTRTEAWQMVEETKAYTLLRGVRGEPPSDIDSLIDVILRLSQIVSRFKEISELEINPLFVYEEKKGCLALDIRATIRK